jgi:tricorn protease
MLLLPMLLAVQGNPAFDPGPNPLLMQHPTMNETHIVFQFANDLWSVPKAGGDAVRLTSSRGVEASPFFSPDGKSIAFSGEMDGNFDVYTVPSGGGVPKRLTADPAADLVAGWSPDGKSVVFASELLSNTDLPRLFTVSAGGGYPKSLPLPSGTMASFSPDGKKLAYVPGIKWEQAWKRYRGGQTYYIWIADMTDSKVKAIPRDNTNDEQPAWLGNKVFFMSDKRGPVGLYSYDTTSGKVTEEIAGSGFDIKSISAGPGGIVYEKLGSIHIYDPQTKKSSKVPIEIHADFPEVRPQFKDLQQNLSGASISPSGARLAVSARGWVMTVPASKGDARLLDETQGIHRRDPAWSPDGKTVAYITDVNNKQQLALYDLATSKERLLELGESPAYYYAPNWSADNSKIVYTDNRNSIWFVDVKTGKNTKVDSTIYNNPRYGLSPRWSPDSKWLTWSRDLENHLNAIFVYNTETGAKTQVTDGLADARDAIFDRDGKHLYFYASTNVGQGTSWLDLSSFNSQNPTSSVYAVVLRKDLPNPLHPESDEEKPKETPAGPPAKQEEPKFNIDVDGIEYRIISLPIPNGQYVSLEPGPAGSFFALARAGGGPFGGPTNIGKFSFSDRKFTPFAQGASGIQTTPDGSKALLVRGNSFSIVPTAAPPQPGQGGVDLSGLRVKIEPLVEWRRMFHEIWRNEKMLFYSPTTNGIDCDEMDKRYEPFLKNIYSRDDLNYLFIDMLGELCVGHMFPGGGDTPSAGQRVGGGLLGADYSFENGRYKLTRIYDGERWNPGLYAPLAQPGINAKPGEYLLAIDGKDLTDSMDVYESLENKAGKQVRIKLGPSANGVGAREVIVVPVGNEFGLRQRAWAEDNRRYVEKATGGRAGYVHVPDTGFGGWTEFNRYYYAQVGKDGVVIDERFNHGGLINDFMIREMQKPLDALFAPRYGKDWPTPGSSIYGPKVMLINQFAGSGGDMFPWLFRHQKVGKLVGKRTWGGLIAAFGFVLPDGGQINSPDIAFYNPHTNSWEVENWGVAPDIDVELDPYLWRQGRDSQLEKAVEQLNKELAAYKPPKYQRPAYPDRTKIVRY